MDYFSNRRLKIGAHKVTIPGRKINQSISRKALALRTPYIRFNGRPASPGGYPIFLTDYLVPNRMAAMACHPRKKRLRSLFFQAMAIILWRD
ncbi:hypothetical protein ACLOJK_033371 [Asimina triloba]